MKLFKTRFLLSKYVEIDANIAVFHGEKDVRPWDFVVPGCQINPPQLASGHAKCLSSASDGVDRVSLGTLDGPVDKHLGASWVRGDSWYRIINSNQKNHN